MKPGAPCPMLKRPLSETLTAGLLVLMISVTPAFALSELQKGPGEFDSRPIDRTTIPQTTDDEEPADGVDEPGLGVPDSAIGVEDKSGTDVTVPDGGTRVPMAPVEVLRDVSKIPEPVAKMRTLIIEAAASGDINRLKALMNPGPNQTQITIGETSADPIADLKDMSGDDDGIEILSILLDILSTGFVHVDEGTPDEMYVWPYFTEKQLETLTPPEKVELLRIVTAGDYSDMLEFGGYNFYRVGITPKGEWKFFVAGD